MSKPIGFYKKDGKTRPITKSKGKSKFHGQTKSSSWRISSIHDIKRIGNPEGEYHHIRVRDPDYFSPDSFRVIEFDGGIKATIGCRKGEFREGRCQNGTEVQNVMFPKEKYTRREASEWVKRHDLKKKGSLS